MSHRNRKRLLNLENNSNHVLTGITMLLAASFIADISQRLPVLPECLPLELQAPSEGISSVQPSFSQEPLISFLFSQKAFQLLFNFNLVEDKVHFTQSKVLTNNSMHRVVYQPWKTDNTCGKMPFYSQNMFHLGPGT